MTGLIFYMITGAAISIYRLYISEPHPSDPWKAQREKHLEVIDSFSLFIKVPYILLMSALALPVAILDGILFFRHYIEMRRYNSYEVKNDVYKYIQFGVLYGEAVSYSGYNRFSPEETEQLEEVFKEAEQRIIQHGFIPLTLGNFVELHQENKPLPKLRIKGKVYEK